MKFFLLLLFLSVTNFGQAQCKSGNCVDGTGTYDFSWCLYKGEFKNGKPEGTGTMKYDDYTYTGNFVNGLEDGEGEITNNNGSKELVQFSKGIKQVNYLEKIAAKDYKPIIPQDINCLSGDCINGIGTYQYPSGNKYVGNRVNYKMEGKGIVYFSNKDKLYATFHDNKPVVGTYTYISGATYKGTYNADGLELNGTITSPAGMAIPYVNGKPVIPPKPKVEVAQNQNNNNSSARRERIKTTCGVCFGRGSQSRIEDWSSSTRTCLMRVPVTCYKCHGSGVE